MNTAFFFQTQQIPDSSSIFDQLKQQNIFFSYFQVDLNYYLFLYAQKSIDINFLYQSIDVIQELDSKQRKIRSFRGFFLYALEIMQTGKDYEILTTNLQPFFWRKVKNIIRQNKKGALLEFLFGKAEVNQDQTDLCFPHLEDQIQRLQNQVNSLQERLSHLENQNLETQRNLNILSATDRRLKSHTSKLEEGLTPSNQEKGLNRANFITLSQIPEEEQIEIIQKGFQLQAESKISLKKYYESTEEYSLFQLKGYSIKYEPKHKRRMNVVNSIRRTKLYQQLKIRWKTD